MGPRCIVLLSANSSYKTDTSLWCRQQAWLLVSAALVAVGKSHGAYDRKEGVATCKISLVLEVRQLNLLSLHATRCFGISLPPPPHPPMSLRVSVFVRAAGADSLCVSYVVRQDAVVTLAASLVQRFVGARGWGALTEHHLLVAIRDAILADPDATLHRSIGDAVACCVRSATSNDESTQTASYAAEQQQQQRLIALAIDADGAGELDVYSLEAAVGACAVDKASLARQSCLHLLLAPPAAGLNEMTAAGCWGDVGIVRCSLPSGLDCKNSVRTIVALQGHNNCGRLYAAAVALVQQKAMVDSHGCGDIDEQQKKKEKKEKKKEKKEKKEKKQKKEKKEKKEKGDKSMQEELTTRHSGEVAINDMQRTAEGKAGATEQKGPGSEREERKTKRKKKQREKSRCTDVTTKDNHGIAKQKKKKEKREKREN